MLQFLAVLSFCLGLVLGNAMVAERKCKEEEFPKPYVILYHGKGGSEVASLNTQGIVSIMDLEEAVHAYICINGAVIIYRGLSTHKDSNKAAAAAPNDGTGVKHTVAIANGDTLRYSNGTFQIFNHKCMHISRLSRYGPEQVKAKAKNHGANFTGIFLLTTKEANDPANSPLRIMLNRKQFGYKIGADEGVIKDASFVVQGKGPYCLALKDGSKVVLTTTAQDDKELCRWSRSAHHEPDKKYKQLLKKGHPMGDYKWEDCPSDLKVDDSDNADTQGGNGTGGHLKPFATSNPTNKSTNGGSGSSGASEASVNISAPTYSDISSEEVGDPPAKPIIYAIQMEDCVPLPKFDANDPLCEFMKPDNFNCEKLAVALELEAGDDTKNLKTKRTTTQSTSASGNTPLTLSGNPLLRWKHEVLSLVARIFSKICIPIRKQSVFQLMNVIGNYIATAHTADPENSEPNNQFVRKTTIWEIIVASLNRCLLSNTTVPMEWEWTDSIKTKVGKGGPKGKRKRREVSSKSSLKALVFDEVMTPEILNDEEEDKLKLIIERSTSVFDFKDEDEATNEIIFGDLPRWRRNTPNGLEKLPLPSIQEYITPVSQSWDSSSGQSDKKQSHEDFMFHPDPSKIRIKGKATKEIFYYEDVAQHTMELNQAIDAFWKVLSTVIGFCQINEISRGNAVFSILLHNFEEYFLNLIQDQWKNPSIEVEVDMVIGEFVDEDRSKWLDTCMETAYIVADALKFRPVRPLEIEGMSEGSSGNSTVGKENVFIQLPENPAKYFMRKKL